MNSALEAAMSEAGLKPSQLAARVGVSKQTVTRWLSDERLVPYPRNRADVSRALGVDEEVLWRSEAVRSAVKTGPDREIVAMYPVRSACPSSTWGQLIKDATEDLFFGGYTNYFLWLEQPSLQRTLTSKAQAGCRVRFLLGDPDGEVTRARERLESTSLSVSTRIRITLENLAQLAGAPQIEARYSSPDDATNHVSLSVFRFDERALVTPHLARNVGHDSPMMHLRRRDPDGVFAQFAAHAEELWSRGRPVEALKR